MSWKLRKRRQEEERKDRLRVSAISLKLHRLPREQMIHFSWNVQIASPHALVAKGADCHSALPTQVHTLCVVNRRKVQRAWGWLCAREESESAQVIPKR